jgi:hypothetical protein
MKIKQIMILLFFAFIGWAICTATMVIGTAITTIDNALILHAIIGPIGFIILSIIYFKKFKYTTPLQTATVFISFVILVDFFLVALIINKSLEMFTNLLGTWIPFTLIFISTYLTGKLIIKRAYTTTQRNAIYP